MRNHADYSIVVFPFLKTLEAVPIGNHTFRSTEDRDGLTIEQSNSVAEIASMLFLRDNLRIRSASYAVVPYIDLDRQPAEVEHLRDVQAVVAYFYASPRHSFGDLFLSSEHASLVIFSPGDVSIYTLRLHGHVEAVGGAPEPTPDEWGHVPGYAGLYNFRHHFSVADGSRVYGPQPHMILNYAQNLGVDLMRASAMREDYGLLLDMLRRPETATSERIFTAVRWFNAANAESSDEAAAIVSLAIAFEALLGLPENEKTDRLTDAIALLLGRVSRLEVWAHQFYNARSQIVHEGRTQQLRFIATDSRKPSEGSAAYQSLLSYGRQILQLCLGTLLVGAELAEEAGLQEQLATNQERLQRICKLLADEEIEACDRLGQAEPIVDTVEQYRYVWESKLELRTLIGAARLAAKTLLTCDPDILQDLRKGLEKLCAAKRSEDSFEQLEALSELEELFPSDPLPTESDHVRVTHKLVEVVWGYVYMHYFWLKKRRPSP